MSVVGYYVHHHGSGHAQRATTVATALRRRGASVFGLSSAPRPDGWPGHWVELDRDDDVQAPADVEAGGRLHWVPLQGRGLRRRMAQVARWIDEHEPDVIVVDVSVEVGLLARLHGVPVVTLVLPGDRTDPAHALLHDVADRVVAAWPPAAHDMVTGPAPGRVHPVGGISRFDGRADAAAPTPGRGLVALGTGGDDVAEAELAGLSSADGDLTWHVLGRGAGRRWSTDPWEALCEAEVVITHAGQNMVAEVAAARRPAVVVPQQRPHGEQVRTARVLDAGPWPVVSAPSLGAALGRVEEVRRLDGRDWAGWNDGDGAGRAVDVVLGCAERWAVAGAVTTR